MKKELSLLLTLIAPIFLINCSGKTTTMPNPVPNTQSTIIAPPTIITPPILGRPIESNSQSNSPDAQPTTIQPTISLPTTIPTLPNQNIGKPPTTHQNGVVKGTTFLSKKFKLPKKVKESSGLIKIDGRLWTMNDSGGKAELYQIDEKSGRLIRTVRIKGAYNHDWEALTYDEQYVYIGDFGNNRGNRRDLKVYKISRAELKYKKQIKAKSINFSFSDQKSFRSRPRKHNFDCEAMVAYHGKLFLFSKDWQDHKTRLYELSTAIGKHKAYYRDSFNVQGLITDASINKKLDILLLTSYSELLSVNVWAFTNYKKENFFQGLSKKLTLNSLNAQVEGITFIDNYRAYLSSESFSKYIFSFDSMLYEIDFSKEFQ